MVTTDKDGSADEGFFSARASLDITRKYTITWIYEWTHDLLDKSITTS